MLHTLDQPRRQQVRQFLALHLGSGRPPGVIRAHLHRFISPRWRVLIHRATLQPRSAATYAFTVHGSSRNVELRTDFWRRRHGQ